MARRILVTGGAGFIGSHLADALLRAGDEVRVLDSLHPQVHGQAGGRPPYLAEDVDLQEGDVADPVAVERALAEVDAVVHLAARVGVGQSMYEMARYTHANTYATSVLLEGLLRHPVRRLVVASSMSVYGEGLYRLPDGTPWPHATRTSEPRWDPVGPNGEPLEPIPTPETKPPNLASLYALTKFDQERMCLIFGQAYRQEVVALRFFNAYGPRQALSNPYTGVLAIFAARLLNGQPPLVFEDGEQRRDFVSVHDVVQGCLLALDHPEAAGEVFNIGSGRCLTVNQVAEAVAAAVHRPDLPARVTGQFRAGDIRHCYADISKARDLLGYEPKVGLEEGLEELARWLATQEAEDRTVEAHAELAARGLAV